MEILLVLLYAGLALLWILRGKLWKRFSVNRRTLGMIFAAKVLLGIGYGLVYQHYYQTGDIVHYFQDSKIIYSALPERPDDYLLLTFGYTESGEAPERVEDLYGKMRLSWRTQEYLSVRVNSVLNLFPFGHYYVNVVLLSLISLLSLALLHRTIANLSPDRGRILAVAIFMVPSSLFWCSGIHKDSITLIAMSLVLYGMIGAGKQIRVKGRWPLRIQHIVAFFSGCFLLLNSRSYLLVLVLPNVLLYLLSLRIRIHKPALFAGINLLMGLALTQIHLLIPRLNFLAKMQFEQDFLLQLRGNTHLDMQPVGETLSQLLTALPKAFEHVLISPISYPPVHLFQWLSRIDAFLQLGLILLLLFWILRGFRSIQSTPEISGLACFLLIFSLGLMALIGLTVPALGAIVRYKATVLPFLFTALTLWLPPAPVNTLEGWLKKLV